MNDGLIHGLANRRQALQYNNLLDGPKVVMSPDLGSGLLDGGYLFNLTADRLKHTMDGIRFDYPTALSLFQGVLWPLVDPEGDWTVEAVVETTQINVNFQIIGMVLSDNLSITTGLVTWFAGYHGSYGGQFPWASDNMAGGVSTTGNTNHGGHGVTGGITFRTMRDRTAGTPFITGWSGLSGESFCYRNAFSLGFTPRFVGLITYHTVGLLDFHCRKFRQALCKYELIGDYEPVFASPELAA